MDKNLKQPLVQKQNVDYSYNSSGQQRDHESNQPNQESLVAAPKPVASPPAKKIPLSEIQAFKLLNKEIHGQHIELSFLRELDQNASSEVNETVKTLKAKMRYVEQKVQIVDKPKPPKEIPMQS